LIREGTEHLCTDAFPYVSDALTKYFDDDVIVLHSCIFCWRMLKYEKDDNLKSANENNNYTISRNGHDTNDRGFGGYNKIRRVFDLTHIWHKMLPLTKEFIHNPRVLQAICTLISHVVARVVVVNPQSSPSSTVMSGPFLRHPTSPRIPSSSLQSPLKFRNHSASYTFSATSSLSTLSSFDSLESSSIASGESCQAVALILANNPYDEKLVLHCCDGKK
jgi:hypothetical protein